MLIQRRVGHTALQARILHRERPQSPKLTEAHVRTILSPLLERPLIEPPLAAPVGDGSAALGGSARVRDQLIRELRILHRSTSSPAGVQTANMAFKLPICGPLLF